MKITEGYMPFKEGKTYYRITGEAAGSKKPLILLHGGPGSTHNYFEVLDYLAERDGRQLIMYDQIGCGNSFIEGHKEYFNADTWIEELDALREHLNLKEVHIMGQSWGGMMALLYALGNKEGVKSFVLSSTLPSAKLWEEEQWRRIGYMAPKYQEALKTALATGNYSDPAYLEALDVFMHMHCSPDIDENSPECLRREKKAGREAYVTGWGENEFTPTGTLSGFEVTDRLHEIKTPCLITDGQRDLCSPYIAKTMYDRIPNSEWELFRYSRHMPFVEETERYIEVLINWLNKND